MTETRKLSDTTFSFDWLDKVIFDLSRQRKGKLKVIYPSQLFHVLLPSGASLFKV